MNELISSAVSSPFSESPSSPSLVQPSFRRKSFSSSEVSEEERERSGDPDSSSELGLWLSSEPNVGDVGAVEAEGNARDANEVDTVSAEPLRDRVTGLWRGAGDLNLALVDEGSEAESLVDLAVKYLGSFGTGFLRFFRTF